jgi:hypothetical protein
MKVTANGSGVLSGRQKAKTRMARSKLKALEQKKLGFVHLYLVRL